MEERTIENNIVTVSGELVSDFTFSHEMYGEGFYVASLSAKRESGVADIIPIMVSGRLIDVKADWQGRMVEITGQFRSYNKHTENGNHLILSVFVRGFEEVGELPFWEDENYIFLDGYICKPPIYRKTPLGREIADVFITVNRPYGKSDYIPCVVWGRNARFASGLEIGTHISLEGRIQSREYEKRIGNTEIETRTAYEVSASKISTVEEMEDNENEEEN